MHTDLEELKDVLIGKFLGTGAYRNVYECKIDKTLVVKIEKEQGNFSNVREWTLWEEVQMTPFEKYFAPCINISGNGNILIQKRVRPALQKELPIDIPYFFTDVKPNNFGFIGEKFVCCDYGSIPLSRTWTSKKTIKPCWSDYFTDNKIQ